MKRNFAQGNGCALGFRGLVIATAWLLCSGSINICQAAPFDPPAGVWDFVCSGGGQRGMAYLTFSNQSSIGGTFSGFVLLAGTPTVPPEAGDGGGRNLGGGERRGDLSSTTNSVTGQTNSIIFGFTPLDGPWQFDSRGRVIGSFNEIVNATSVATNFLPSTRTEEIADFNNPGISTNIVIVFTNNQAVYTTNFTWPSTSTFEYVFVNTNFTLSVVSGEITNSVSFVGSVRPGKRFNFVSFTSFGKTTFRGVPSATLLNLDGSQWYGSKRQRSQKFIEFFDLHSFSTPHPFGTDFPGIENYPNIYWTTNGIGPSYGLSGVVVLSSQKRIGFFFNEEAGVDSALRASYGPFINNKRTTQGVTTGVREPTTRIGFNAVKQP